MNIVGPHGPGIRETTTRPIDTASNNPIDTWFEDCRSGDPNTGTKVPAVWLNKCAALFRRAIRGLGIADTEAGDTSDNMLRDAILRGGTLANVGDVENGIALYDGQNGVRTHLIRKLLAGSNVSIDLVEGADGREAVRIAASGNGGGALSIPYVADTSSVANTIEAVFSPEITSLAAGLIIEVKLANLITGATDILVNAITSKAVKRPDGTNLQAGDAVAGQMLLLMYTGTVFQLIGIRSLIGTKARKRVAVDTNSACVALSTTIPMGFYSGETLDALPLISHGTQILSATVNPASVGSKFNVRVQGFTHVYAGYSVTAVFRNNTCIKAYVTSGYTGGNWLQPLVCDVEDAPATTSPVVYSVRVGPHRTSYAVTINGFIPGGIPQTTGVNGPLVHLFGAAGTTHMMIDEILE